MQRAGEIPHRGVVLQPVPHARLQVGEMVEGVTDETAIVWWRSEIEHLVLIPLMDRRQRLVT